MKHYKKYKETCTCLNCEHPIYGRPDKKFCSADCKDKYHNKQKRITKDAKKMVLTSLNHNYDLLCSLLECETNNAQRKWLCALGFKEEYCTFTYSTNYKRIYRCYNIEYQFSETKIYNIRKI